MMSTVRSDRGGAFSGRTAAHRLKPTWPAQTPNACIRERTRNREIVSPAFSGLRLLRADPNYLRFRGFGVLRGLGDSWRPVFFALGVGGAEGDEVNISVKISSKARSAGLGGALARSWSP